MNKTMKVTDLLRSAQSSIDFSSFDGSPGAWMMLIQNKASDSGFDGLVDSILENGWEDGSAIGFDGHGITEGHHRLAAAILLALDEVPVTMWGEDTWGIDAHFDADNLANKPLEFFTPEDGMLTDICPCGCNEAF